MHYNFFTQNNFIQKILLKIKLESNSFKILFKAILKLRLDVLIT